MLAGGAACRLFPLPAGRELFNPSDNSESSLRSTDACIPGDDIVTASRHAICAEPPARPIGVTLLCNLVNRTSNWGASRQTRVFSRDAPRVPPTASANMRPRPDPELGVTKKDDDLYVKGARGSTGWRARGSPRIPPRKTFKRLGLICLLAAAVYLFVHNIPTDLGPQDKRHPFYAYGGAKKPSPPIPPISPIPNEIYEQQPPALTTRDYDGPLRFLNLAESLHAISETKGSSQNNRNILYMASTIQSANKLLPIACQMGRELRSYVHFALVSRDEVTVNQLRDINGIGGDCDVIFHGMRHLQQAFSCYLC